MPVPSLRAVGPAAALAIGLAAACGSPPAPQEPVKLAPKPEQAPRERPSKSPPRPDPQPDANRDLMTEAAETGDG